MGGEFRFVGKGIPVNVVDKVLHCLHAAGVYDFQSKAYDGPVYFGNYFANDYSVKERLGEVDEILAIIDVNRLKNDLEENGYALPMAKGDPGKFKDHKGKGFIANTDRVVQGLVNQKISGEFKLDFGVRHLKAQESAELMVSDGKYMAVANDYWIQHIEVIQKLARQTEVSDGIKGGELDITGVETPVEMASARSNWDTGGGCFVAGVLRPSLWNGIGVAALKKCQSATSASS